MNEFFLLLDKNTEQISGGGIARVLGERLPERLLGLGDQPAEGLMEADRDRALDLIAGISRSSESQAGALEVRGGGGEGLFSIALLEDQDGGGEVSENLLPLLIQNPLHYFHGGREPILERQGPRTMFPCLSSLVAIATSLKNSHVSGFPLTSICRS